MRVSPVCHARRLNESPELIAQELVHEWSKVEHEVASMKVLSLLLRNPAFIAVHLPRLYASMKVLSLLLRNNGIMDAPYNSDAPQ